jgi:hypothetical protein
MTRRHRETRLELAGRIADAYGLVLILVLTTFVVIMTLPPEGAGGRVASVAAAAIAELVPSDRLLGAAFGAESILLAIAAGTILRRVITSIRVDFRTILGAISVYTLFGVLFAFLYLGVDRWEDGGFFTGVGHPQSNDYIFFSYTTLTTTGYGNLVPAGTLGQSLAVFEMLIGQVFLVTLVAGLVSLWRPGNSRGADERVD